MSCRTTQTAKSEYVVPALYFPQFPSPDGNVRFDESKAEVIMSLDYYARICEYKIRVDETSKVYERIREVYEDNK